MSVTQLSFAALGTALYDVTFLVLDLETTGLSPGRDRITEIGAVKVRRGELVGELHALVHPQRPIPPAITAVTGITDAMVAGHPPVGALLPSLLEFARGTVLVAHNARFDTAFLDAALAAHGHGRIGLPVVDTARLARRLLHGEVRNLRLATLARHLNARTQPTHRALADARATVDVLHGLLERAGNLGAATLEDLLDYTRSTTDRAFRKIALVRDAPDLPGVYRFLDAHGEVLYVGKATCLRTRLRTYFGQDSRRRIADLVRDTASVTWTPTSSVLEAEVRELREIQAQRPRYNRAGRNPQRAVLVKLTREAFPRLSIVTARRDDLAVYLGPLPSRRAAEQVVDAIHEAVPLRRCTQRLRLAQDHPACVLAEMGRCGAPCDGRQSREDYSQVAASVASAIERDPSTVLSSLRRRMTRLSRAGRFEDAAEARERLHRLATALHATRRAVSLTAVEDVCLARRVGSGHEVVWLRAGRLHACAVTGTDLDPTTLRLALAGAAPLPPACEHEGALLAEQALIERWLAGEVRVVRAEGTWAEPATGGRVLAEAVAESRSVARARRRDRQDLDRVKVVRRPAVAAAIS